jgi:hypothetical protein
MWVSLQLQVETWTCGMHIKLTIVQVKNSDVFYETYYFKLDQILYIATINDEHELSLA